MMERKPEETSLRIWLGYRPGMRVALTDVGTEKYGSPESMHARDANSSQRAHLGGARRVVEKTRRDTPPRVLLGYAQHP